MLPCPRRSECALAISKPEDDKFVDGRCTFCGGLSGAEIIRRVEAGDAVIPTDKSYKIYLGSEHQKAYLQHLTEPQRRRFYELYVEHKMVMGYPGHFYVLPFFMSAPTPAGG